MQFLKALAIIGTLLPLSLANPGDKPGKPLPGPVQCQTKPSDPQTPAQRQPYLKMTILINKLDNVTSEYFDEYWTKCDIPLALDCPAFVDNVVKFNAIHNTPALRKEISDLRYPTLDYDGIIEFFVKDLEHWQKVTASDCWQTVRKDAQTFTKWPFQFMYGYEVVALDQTNRKTKTDYHYELV